MKKTLVSLAAAAALTTGAMAADKGIDIVTTGQAVIYYETHASGGTTNPATGQKTADIFNKRASAANVGVQLNLGADLGNNFTFGSQISYLGTAGLEKNLVGNTKQAPTQSLNDDLTSQLILSKIFVAKKIGNTTAKIGRQELPKSLSPLAFSEGWNVFKNTFDAILVVNSDIPDTTLVGAYVSKSNSTVGAVGYIDMNNVGANTALGRVHATNGAYMLTVANKSIPMTAITASYYHLSGLQVGNPDGNWNTAGTNIGTADALWLDVKIKGKELPMGLCVGLQYGSIMTDLDTATNAAIKAALLDEDTTAYGVKVGLKPIDALSVSLAYSAVDNGATTMQNTGTGVKTPLYTQMVYNQNAIAVNNNTFVLKGAYNMGDSGKIIVGYGITEEDKTVAGDKAAKYNELDLIYKVKAGGIQYFAALMYITAEDGANIIGDNGYYVPNINGDRDMDDTKLRVWARYAF